MRIDWEWSHEAKLMHIADGLLFSVVFSWELLIIEARSCTLRLYHSPVSPKLGSSTTPSLETHDTMTAPESVYDPA